MTLYIHVERMRGREAERVGGRNGGRLGSHSLTIDWSLPRQYHHQQLQVWPVSFQLTEEGLHVVQTTR